LSIVELVLAREADSVGYGAGAGDGVLTGVEVAVGIVGTLRCGILGHAGADGAGVDASTAFIVCCASGSSGARGSGSAGVIVQQAADN
jgi:hypothetical protein